MGQYKIFYAESTEELEAKMNEAAGEGWIHTSTSLTASPRGIAALVVMERGERAPFESTWQTRFKAFTAAGE